MNNLPREKIQALLNQIAGGSDRAGRTLYAHYQKQIYAYIKFKVWDPDAADEIVSETMYVAFSKPLSYDGVVEYSTWLCGIANNKIKDWRRRSMRYSDEVPLDDQILESLGELNWDPLVVMEQQEKFDAILECIGKLSEGHRVAMYWTAIEEESVALTSEQMDIPIGTVKSRLHHARFSIRRCLDNALGSDYVGRMHE